MKFLEKILELLLPEFMGPLRPSAGAPSVERVFYFIGAAFLFSISLGRW